MKMLCQFCGNTSFKSEMTQYTYQQGDKLLMVEDVPATVCTYCEENYFDIATLKQTEERFMSIHQRDETPTRQLNVPFERWETLRKAS